MTKPQRPKVTFIGFGEAAQAMAKGLAGQGLVLNTYDIKGVPAIDAPCADLRVTPHAHLADALNAATVIFSLVTADQAGPVADEVARLGLNKQLYFDGNSCAPSSKRASAALIDQANGRYVDLAIMAPIHPKLHKTPMLLCGPDAIQALAITQALHMEARLLDGDIGTASSVKMMRSIMVKGLEALSAECLLAAQQAGVSDLVLASLNQSDPEFSWATRGSYNLERMLVHGQRRAAEMREVVKTIEDLGLSSAMAQAACAWQQAIGDLGLEPGDDQLHQRAARIASALTKDEHK